MKEDMFGKEELETVLKELKDNKALCADCVVNEFLKYSCCKVGISG